jgi:hypothetical protein
MTRIHIPLFCALGIAFCACEKHPASQLPEHLRGGDGHAAEAKHGTTAVHAAPHDAKPAADGAHGEAPKFFPEQK